jgi:hypothetical protein
MQPDSPTITAPIDPGAPNDPAAPAEPREPADTLAALHAELESTRRTLAAIRRERDVHKALFEAGAGDLDIGAALIDRDAAAAPERPIADLVGDLKKRKPGLFARGTPGASAPAPVRPPAGAMGVRATPDDPKRIAAERAAAGDRGSLMTYLRLRRQPA